MLAVSILCLIIGAAYTCVVVFGILSREGRKSISSSPATKDSESNLLKSYGTDCIEDGGDQEESPVHFYQQMSSMKPEPDWKNKALVWDEKRNEVLDNDSNKESFYTRLMGKNVLIATHMHFKLDINTIALDDGEMYVDGK